MKKLRAAELQDLLLRRRKASEALAESGAKRYAYIIRRIDAAILRRLERVDTELDAASVAALVSDMRKVLSSASAAVLEQADKDALEAFRLSFETQLDYMRSAGSLSRSSRQVAQAFAYYEQRITSGEILRGEYWRIKRQEWSQEFVDEQRKVLRAVQAQMTRGLASGSTSPRDVAAALRGPLGGLQISGRMDPEAFAAAFTRTQYAQVENDLAVSLATQAQIEKFVNVGVPDDRQSLECYEASQQPPMTMLEWDAWRASNGKGGRPGSRHVMNCRCIAGAVPPALEGDDWTQPNPKFEEAEA